MNRPIALALVTTTLLGSVLWAGTASAQQKSFKDQIVGAWILVSTDNTAPDGSKQQIWGPNPTGMLVLDASGRFTQIIVRSDRPKFKANNRMQGSPRHGPWTRDQPEVLSDDGWRHHGRERAGQGLGVYGAPTWQRRQLTKGQNGCEERCKSAALHMSLTHCCPEPTRRNVGDIGALADRSGFDMVDGARSQQRGAIG